MDITVNSIESLKWLLLTDSSTFLVILDSSEDDCQLANFRLGTSSGTIRSWEIKVTQYKCDNVDVSGPPGCLQYYTSTNGIIQSFNFPSPTVTTIGSTVTHLSNQNYEVCIRRDINACFVSNLQIMKLLLFWIILLFRFATLLPLTWQPQRPTAKTLLV